MTNVLDPIESKVAARAALKTKLNSLQAKADELGGKIQSHASFDAEKHAANLSDFHSQKENFQHDLKNIKSSMDRYIAESNFYKSKAVSPLKIFNYFSTEQTTIRAQIDKLDQHCKKLKSNVAAIEKQITDLDHTISINMNEINDYRSFDINAARNDFSEKSTEIDALSRDISTLDSEIASIEEKCGAQIAEYKRCIQTLSALEARIARAEAMDRNISSAANGYERAMIHQECGRLYGIDKPRRVISEANSEIRKIRNDLSKIERRLKTTFANASRNIGHVVIDGNNAAYHHSEFIRLVAVTNMVDALSTKFKVTVVFDASIRRLMQADDTKIKSIIGRVADTYITPSKTAADEYILKITENDPSSYIISNDRFAEYRDYDAVRDNRIIKFMLTSEKVIITDLDITIPLPSQTF